MSAKAVVYLGLGGSRRLESGEYDATLEAARYAGRNARIDQVPFKKALQGVPRHLRMEFKRGYESICK